MSWEKVKLGNLVEFSQGLQVPIENQFEKKQSNFVRFIRIVDYTNENEPIRYINKPNDKYFVDYDDIVMIRYGSQTAGKVVRGITGVIANNTFKINIAVKGLDKDYLFRFLSQNRIYKELNSGQGSSTMPAVSFGNVKNIIIEYPHLPTQKRIASILSTYDDLIENNLKRIKLLEETAQNIYKEWFVNFRFPNYENTPFNEETGLPVGWEVKKLSELYNTSSGGTPKRDNPNYYEGNIKWFRTNELQDNFLIDSELHISEDALKNSSAKLFPKNTVLMAMYGATIGRLGVLTEEASTNQACCGIIPINENFGNSFIYYWLLKNREHILSLRMGAAQENISQTIIKDLEVIKPSSIILKEFNSKIDKINEIKINLTIQNQKLKEARDILLPRLMNRTIEV